jgi:hypothetical protein
MTDVMVNSTPRKRRWLRLLTWILAILIALAVTLYFVATSASFLKGVILPQLSKTLHADVTVADASIHPFREISLRDLKVQPKGQQPIITAPEVRVRYNLWDILRGNLRVDEVTLTGPTVLIVKNPDGSSNLDPILKAPAKKAPAKKAERPAKPPQVELRKLALKNATLRLETLYGGDHRDIIELATVNVALENLKNAQSGKLTLSADLEASNNPPSPAGQGLVQAALNGSFDFALSSDLKPVSVQGRTELAVSRAEGALSQLAGFKASLNCTLTSTKLKELALRFQKNGEQLGELAVGGPLDVEKTEGLLKVELLSIDKRLLNLLGAASGVDFGSTTVNSTNEVQLTNGGSIISIAGRFNVNQLQLTRTNQSTPKLDLHADYSVTLNNAESQALVRVLTVDGTENGAPLLRAGLTSPMTVAWGSASNTVGDSSLDLTVTRLNLADWKPFLGGAVSAGEVNAQLHLLSQQGGQRLAFDLDSGMENLSIAAGGNQIAQAGVRFQARGQATDLKQLSLIDCKFEVSHRSQPILTVSASGQYDLGQQSADMQLALQASLARLFGVLGRPDVTAASGTAELKAHLTQSQNTQTIAGNLVLADFTGQLAENKFNAFGGTMELDVSKMPGQIKINKVAGRLTQGGQAGGGFNLSGSYDLTNNSAALNVTLADFNQNGLRPFTEPLLTDRKLVSIVVNGNASVQYDPTGKSTLQAGIQVTNLVVSDPQLQFPATPLEAKLQVDTALQKQSVDVRQLQITLTPTPRAQNMVQLEGQVDFSRTNAIQGNLKLAANSVDLTGYYDLFAGKKPEKVESAAPAREATPPRAPAPTNQEPAAKQLPFHNFTMQANIGRLYLHEVEITNLSTTVNLDGGRVLLKPCQLTLNGAPVNATVDLDLGVPGYQYALAFNAEQAPLAPLVDTFEPDRRGQLGGTLTAHAQINGVGTTGASLQKSLKGQFDVGATNLNLSVANVRSPVLKTVINVVATVPELLHNPAGAVGNLLGGFTGRGGLMNELSKSPLDVIAARGSAGEGRINLQQAVVRSSAFEADAQGTITIARVLTNSPIQIPVAVSLSHAIAEQLNLAAGANTAYVKLPDFLTVKGTAGQPKAEINKLALFGTTLKAVGGTVPGTNIKPGGLLQGLGGLLGGQKSGSTAATTNPPANTQPPVKNLLNDLFGTKK